MIKINLSTSKKPLDLTNVGGFDFSQVKVYAVMGAIVFMFLPDLFMADYFTEELEKAQGELTSRQAELTSLQRKIGQSQDLEKQIRELKAQEENLGKKLTAVKQAISEKKNPTNVLLYMAKNTPPELWLREIAIKNDVMNIKGEAYDYTSIGSFVNNLRSSVFIKDSNISSTGSAVREQDKRRVENFEVNFTIGRFEQ